MHWPKPNGAPVKNGAPQNVTNTGFKGKFESAVIASLIKEITFLNLDKILNEELVKFNADKNKTNTFTLNNIEREIEITRMRIELLERDSDITINKSKYKSYIDELSNKLTDLNNSRESIKNEIFNASINSVSIDINKSRLKHFINNIHSETPDKQNILLKEFIKSINYNLMNDVIEIRLIIKSLENSAESLFEKMLYTTL